MDIVLDTLQCSNLAEKKSTGGYTLSITHFFLGKYSAGNHNKYRFKTNYL